MQPRPQDAHVPHPKPPVTGAHTVTIVPSSRSAHGQGQGLLSPLNTHLTGLDTIHPSRPVRKSLSSSRHMPAVAVKASKKVPTVSRDGESVEHILSPAVAEDLAYRRRRDAIEQARRYRPAVPVVPAAHEFHHVPFAAMPYPYPSAHAVCVNTPHSGQPVWVDDSMARTFRWVVETSEHWPSNST